MFCGPDEWTEIEAFGKHRGEWLKSFLPLPNGIPLHDTFQRVFGRLDGKQFAACLFGWMQALQKSTDGKVVAIDGRLLRRSGSSEPRPEVSAPGHRIGDGKQPGARSGAVCGKVE